MMLNELLINPEGKDTSAEWIELYNDSDSLLDLSGWIIAGKKHHILPQGVIADKNSYTIIDNLNFALRNNDTTIKLLNQNHQIIDQVYYDTAPSGMSFGRTELDSQKWEWAAPTPGTKNTVLAEKNPAPEILIEIPIDSGTRIQKDLQKDWEYLLLIPLAMGLAFLICLLFCRRK